jgi:hypothetical protein
LIVARSKFRLLSKRISLTSDKLIYKKYNV